MIIGNVKDAQRYFCINPKFRKAFEFLNTLDENSKSGPFEFEEFNGNILTFNSLSEDSDNTETELEAHKEYLDIHYVIQGSEAIGYANIDTLKVSTEYKRDEDYLLLKGDMYKVYLKEGDFCIVFPEDAHAPSMYAWDKNLKKAVVKIRV